MDDYFSQYGMGDNTLTVHTQITKSSDKPLSLETSDKNKIIIKGGDGSPKAIPTLQYVADLENRIIRLDDMNRSMRSQILFLNTKVTQLSSQLIELSKKNFNNYDY